MLQLVSLQKLPFIDTSLIRELFNTAELSDLAVAGAISNF